MSTGRRSLTCTCFDGTVADLTASVTPYSATDSYT